jgi:RsiW-degrading membrane proteinase PrsW (M82 family)
MLWDTMIDFLKSWFNYPGLAWHFALIGIVLAIVFGAIWLLGYWPPLFKKPWFWAVAIVSAFLTLLAIVFVQIPLQYYIGQALGHFWNTSTLNDWLLLAYIPTILVTGLVQEGAKMVPMVFWWWRSGRNIDPRLGLAIGALAGAGFGIFESAWAHSQVFLSGWTWQAINTDGLVVAMLPFWDRFWAVAMHIAVSAIVGYGLAKGKGWQFYLIAAGLHSLVNYIVLPYSKGMLTYNQVEVYIAAVAALVTLWALWLRWRKKKEEEQLQPDKPVGIDV